MKLRGHWSGFITLVIILSVCVVSQRQDVCEFGSCYPATGDLVIGREQNLTASSTCGLQRPQRYCIVSHLEEVTKCFTCDSRRPFASIRYRNSHRIENVVSSFRDRHRRWWQAENGQEKAYIQLDLESEFHFTHLIMTFKTFRPKAMLIERSSDKGRTWHVYRYFASDCSKSFPGVPTGTVDSLTDVICESKYSDVVPATRGEVIFRVLPPNIRITNPYSQEVQDLLKLTNLRINFTELHTLGDDLLAPRPDIQEKYYYAMYDMTVRGSCSCYGHASRCNPLPGLPNRPDMVHGKCECMHNTKGLNCEMCEDFYQDLPWRPAMGRQTNACQKCKCNNHATSCRFDPALYEASGRVSGGICLECRHNTIGTHCEDCKPFFYHDPNLPLSHPDTCRPCDCDPAGSLSFGECHARGNAAKGEKIGACVCRTNVGGRRCDTCKDGFWNLRTNNPLGCEDCSCNTIGTIGNLGCDKISGLCRCKRYVAGRDCDQCYPTFWGLNANNTDGCLPCDCDVGGSLIGECHPITGQCRCRENIIGRKCNKPKPGFFFPNLDFNVYEAENAKGSDNTRKHIRAPYPNREPTWTGPGFMKIKEGDSIEFVVDGIKLSMFYDIIIRYEPIMPERWDDVRVSVVRPGTVDINGVCANIIPQDDLKPATLHPGSRYVVLTPRTCLEKGVDYKVKVDFNKYKSDRVTPEATVLIDSVALVPNIDSIPIFQGRGEPERMKEEFIYYRCRQYQFGLVRGQIPEVCKKYIFSISAVIHSRALQCRCNPTGSESLECDTLGGQCHCKNNVIGRICDQCAPGTYGFGQQGCIPCNCDPTGARDNNCDLNTGQCLCIPNAYGRTCGECQKGFWRFPQCHPCDCNNNAVVCDNLSGDCLNCTRNTAGKRCERCAAGYYGDPRLSVGIPCRECQCPGTAASGNQHADSCSLLPFTNEMVCQCKPAYTGRRCESCIDNFFGNPSVTGGRCQACVCNNNIDINVPKSCDPNTGECLRCLFHTTGFNCEKCVEGYYGDATKQGCKECVCNKLGTDSRVKHCDRITGQCPCLPNVHGQYCDRCVSDHWNLASERGCESCSCDPGGSLGSRCNEFSGQCSCIRGRGGRDCSQCKDLYWGNPKVQCILCNCHNEGSESLQCDRQTGQCLCRAGITGLKCDQCARGTTGQLPYCKPCGECFDSWDREIQNTQAETYLILNRINVTKKEGVHGVFEKEFAEIESNLDEVERLLKKSRPIVESVAPLKDLLSRLRKNLTEEELNVAKFQIDLKNSTEVYQSSGQRVYSLRKSVDDLKKTVDELRKNATDVLLEDVEGAYNVTLEARRRSYIAKQRVDQSSQIVSQSAQIRESTSDLIDGRIKQFNADINKVNSSLRRVDNLTQELNQNISDINNMVCDGKGDPCDSECGGGGCNGHCGGDTCGNGALTRAKNALDLAKEAEKLLREKDKEIAKRFGEISKVNKSATEAKKKVDDAFLSTAQAQNSSQQALRDVDDLLDEIRKFVVDDLLSGDIKKVANEVLAMKISLTPSQISDLAKKINETIHKLQDVDRILRETKDDVDMAEQLKARASNASRDAEKALKVAENILSALKGAESAQNKTSDAIHLAESNMTEVRKCLHQIQNHSGFARNISQEIDKALAILIAMKGSIKDLYTESEIAVRKAEKKIENTAKIADDTDAKLKNLNGKYAGLSGEIRNKFNKTSGLNDRVTKLTNQAIKLHGSTQDKLTKLNELFKKSEENEKRLRNWQAEVDRLTELTASYLKVIQDRKTFHDTCTSK